MISLTGDEDGALNDISDNMAEEGGELSKSLISFWKKEDGKRAAMNAFRQALVNLTEPDASGTPSRKLVIVVDELDRCRPDYALSLLEIIKHFFNVAGIQFILGVNLEELRNSVRARYGADVNAADYLAKFVSVQIPLTTSKQRRAESEYSKYYLLLKSKLNLETNSAFNGVGRYLNETGIAVTLSLRDLEKIATQCALLPPMDTGWGSGQFQSLLLPGLVIMRVKNPQLLNQMRQGKLLLHDVLSLFGLDHEVESYQRPIDRKAILALAWRYHLDPKFDLNPIEDHSLPEGMRLNKNDFVHEDFEQVSRANLLPSLIHSYIDAVTPYE